MKRTILFIFIIITMSCEKTVDVQIQTELGNITVELYPEKAPITVANFLMYVDSNRYVDSDFYRVTTLENESEREYQIEVIQGGTVKDRKYFEPIEIETTDVTQVKHVDGAISMARGKPNTATSHFFICIGSQPELDFEGKRNPDGFGFAAFGKVVKGMDIVRQIQNGENERQYLKTRIKINTILRLN